MISPTALAVMDAAPDAAARILSRAIEDALAEATPAYWRRRARTLAAVGTRWASDAAVACANHALLLDAERRGISVVDVLEEVTSVKSLDVV